jgi:uncharacterized coiled-coil protein SlyX
VRYDAVNAMLLNEFIKEHQKIQEQGRQVQEQKSTISQLKTTAAKQEALIAQQQKEMKTVVARLREQDSKIQRVSARVEASKPTSRVVLSKQ